MVDDRPCNVRKSKAYPDAYSKDELVKIAMSNYGYKKSEATSLTKDKLCKLIGTKPKTKVQKNEDIPPCGTRKSNKNPTAYSKDELITLAIRSGMTEKGISKKSVSELCNFLFGQKIEDSKKFDTTEGCKSYTVEQLKKFAKMFKVAPSGTKKVLCDRIIKASIKDLWKQCLNTDISELKRLAKSKGLSVKGKASDICRRIFEEEKKYVSGLEDENDDYIDFFNKYFKSKKEDRDQILSNYSEILPSVFLSKFGNFKHKERKEWYKEYLFPENVTKSPLEFIKEYTRIRKVSSDRDIKINPNISKLPCVKRSKLKLKLHQLRIVEAMLHRRGLIAWHSMGGGKTLSCVAALHCVLEKFPKMKIAIITPTSLQENIKKEIKAYGADPKDKRFYYATINKFVIDNPIKKAKSFKNTFMIVDEAHNLKTFGGTMAKTFIEYAKHAAKVLLLSGTFVNNKPNDIVNSIAMIDGTDPISPQDFDRHIMTDEDAFEEYFKCKISYYNADHTDGYPKQEDHNVEFEMTQSFYKKYHQIEKGFQDKLTKKLFGEDKNLKAFFNGVRRSSNNIESENGPKVNWIIDKIQKENKKNKRNKTLIFSSFLDAGSNLVMKRLDQLKIKYVKIDGNMSILERKEFVEDYNNNIAKVIIISKAGAEGLDLKGTRHVIVMEPSWNMSTLYQVVARGNRFLSHEDLPQNERKVDVWHLYMVKPQKRFKDDQDIESIDIEVSDIANEKQEEINDFINRLIPYTIERISCIGA